MKNLKRTTLTAFATTLIFTTAGANAVILDFEDVGVQNNFYPTEQIGFQSMGFQFSTNSGVVDLEGSYWDLVANVGGAHSGDFVGGNLYYGDITMTLVGGGLFSFQNAYIKEWWFDHGITSFIRGYLGNNVVGQINYVMSPDWQLITGNINNIDRLVFSAGYTGSNIAFVVDDITVNTVPIPAAAWLFGSGLIGLIGLSRRKARA